MDIEDQREALRDLVRLMMERTGLDATGLARAAGVVPSTLTRFLNKPVKHLLTARTLAKLATASGVPAPFGGSVTSPLERELLARFRSTDDQGRDMLMRFSRSVSPAQSEVPPVAPTQPEDPPLSRPRVGGNVAENEDIGDCAKAVRLPGVPA